MVKFQPVSTKTVIRLSRAQKTLMKIDMRCAEVLNISWQVVLNVQLLCIGWNTCELIMCFIELERRLTYRCCLVSLVHLYFPMFTMHRSLCVQSCVTPYRLYVYNCADLSF